MRISTEKNDPGYRLYAEAQAQGIHYLVELNGERIRRVITADDVTSEVVVPAQNADGSLRIDRTKGEVLRETLRGRVRLIRRHPHWGQG